MAWVEDVTQIRTGGLGLRPFARKSTRLALSSQKVLRTFASIASLKLIENPSSDEECVDRKVNLFVYSNFAYLSTIVQFTSSADPEILRLRLETGSVEQYQGESDECAKQDSRRKTARLIMH